MTGTSMAAPHVTAAVAYIKMMQPDISVSSVENQLKSMSQDLGPKGKDKYFGYGCPIIGSLFTDGLKYTGKVAPVTGKVEITRLSNKKGGIKISWKKTSKAEKYGVYRRTVTGSYKRIATVSRKKQSYLDKKASSGKKYIYMVKGFRYDIAGANGVEKTIRRMKNVSKIKIKKKTKKTLTLSWKKGKKATGYEIRYSFSKSMKKKNLVAVVKNKATLTGLKGKYCYYQIRACSKDGLRTYHSAWSKKQKVKLGK
jgi:cell wall-associated protease